MKYIECAGSPAAVMVPAFHRLRPSEGGITSRPPPMSCDRRQYAPPCPRSIRSRANGFLRAKAVAMMSTAARNMQLEEYGMVCEENRPPRDRNDVAARPWLRRHRPIHRQVDRLRDRADVALDRVHMSEAEVTIRPAMMTALRSWASAKPEATRVDQRAHAGECARASRTAAGGTPRRR